MSEGNSSPETGNISTPPVSPKETPIVTSPENKKDTVNKFLGDLRISLQKLIDEVKGATSATKPTSSPTTEVLSNPAKTSTETPVPKEGSITEGAGLSKPQGFSLPTTEMIINPPASATETQIPAGYTEVGTANLPTTQTSAGGNALPNVLPPPPGPLAPPLQ